MRAILVFAVLFCGCGGMAPGECPQRDYAGPCDPSSIEIGGRCLVVHWSSGVSAIEAGNTCYESCGSVAAPHDAHEADLFKAMTAGLDMWIGCTDKSAPSCDGLAGECAYISRDGETRIADCADVTPTAFICDVPR